MYVSCMQPPPLHAGLAHLAQLDGQLVELDLMLDLGAAGAARRLELEVYGAALEQGVLAHRRDVGLQGGQRAAHLQSREGERPPRVFVLQLGVRLAGQGRPASSARGTAGAVA